MSRARCVVQLPDGAWAGDVTTAHPEATLRVLGTVGADPAGTALVEVDGPSPSRVYATVEGHENVRAVTSVTPDDVPSVLRVDLAEAPLVAAAESAGVPLQPPVVVREGVARMALYVARERLGDLVDRLEAVGCSATIEALHDRADAERLLTDRQEEVVLTALELGYYESPRDATLTEVADAVGIAKSTCSGVLHRAESRIVRRFAENGCAWETAAGRDGDLVPEPGGSPGENRPSRADAGRAAPAETTEGTSDGDADAPTIDVTPIGDGGAIAETEDVLDVLGDERLRDLFRSLQTPTSVPEIVEQTDLSTSTAYRRIERLEAAGLVEPVGGSGTEPTRYRRTVEGVAIDV